MNRAEEGFLAPMSPENFKRILRVERSAQTSEEELREMLKKGMHFLPWTLSKDGTIFFGKHDHRAKLEHNRIPPEDEWLRGDYRVGAGQENDGIRIEAWHDDSLRKFCDTLNLQVPRFAPWEAKSFLTHRDNPYFNAIKEALDAYRTQIVNS